MSTEKPTFRQRLIHRMRHPLLQGYVLGVMTWPTAIVVYVMLQAV